MIILSTAVGYKEAETGVFFSSLRRSDYKGRVILVTDDVTRATRNDAESVLFSPSGLPLNSDRFLWYRKILDKERGNDSVMLTDIRDVLFQWNPELLHMQEMHVFCEHSTMTLGLCPYNGPWIRDAFSQGVLDELRNLPIICAGVTYGPLQDMKRYVDKMCEMLTTRRQLGWDQAIHNVIFRQKWIDAIIHDNDTGPVYTVGYIPRETLSLDVDGRLHNGGFPCVVHQYDRHRNLTTAFQEKYLGRG